MPPVEWGGQRIGIKLNAHETPMAKKKTGAAAEASS
jgi:hypothetical protein